MVRHSSWWSPRSLTLLSSFLLLVAPAPAFAAITFSPKSPNTNSDIYATTNHSLGLTNVQLVWSGPSSGSAGCAPGRQCGTKRDGKFHWDHHMGKLPAGTYQVTFKGDQCSNKVCERATLTVSPPCSPTTEICDGKDNNCNGQIDEGVQRGCYSGDPKTKNVGECKAGSQICLGGSWGACIKEVTPTQELCNDKLDNDCDGQTDESCECQAGQSRPCYSGDPKTANVGICKSGTQTCQNGGWSTCSGEITPKVREVCGDNLDNNCDGTIDDGCQCTPNEEGSCYTGPDGTQLVGACKAGKRTCSPQGTWSTCEGEVTPQKEICNNAFDEDCDGQLDNGCFPAAENSASEQPSAETPSSSDFSPFPPEQPSSSPDSTSSDAGQGREVVCERNRRLACDGGKCQLICPTSDPPRQSGCSCSLSPLPPSSLLLGAFVLLFLLRRRRLHPQRHTLR